MSQQDGGYNRALFETARGRSEQTKMALVVSCGIRATLQISNDTERVVGRIIGVSDGELLVVRVAPSEIFDDIRDNRPGVIMRFAAEGNVYGFKTSVLGVLDHPAVVLLQWPTQVESVKLRVHDRVPCFISSHVKVGGQTFEIVVTDLSPGGCRIAVGREDEHAKAALTLEKELVVMLPTGSTGLQEITSRIKGLAKGESPKYGVMFERLDQDQRLAIDQLIDNIRAVW